MGLQPPRTIGTRQVTSSALLEPAYDAGGDAFDHSLTDDVLHLSLLDAMGHDLAASRATRRDGGTLTDIATSIDSTLNQWIPDRMMTAVIARLGLADGSLTWNNCGHPAPSGSRHPRCWEPWPHGTVVRRPPGPDRLGGWVPPVCRSLARPAGVRSPRAGVECWHLAGHAGPGASASAVLLPHLRPCPPRHAREHGAGHRVHAPAPAGPRWRAWRCPGRCRRGTWREHRGPAARTSPACA
ncbi:PP2C family protein-serine/threonine phosphatase [Streptomyces chartreusis]